MPECWYSWACSSPPSFPFFGCDPSTTETYTLSLHDALPISSSRRARWPRARSRGRPPRRTSPRSDRKSTRLNSSHLGISYAVFCLKKKIGHCLDRLGAAAFLRSVLPVRDAVCDLRPRGGLQL